MELECDLGSIQNEELLRKMWQQSEDSERKKQIRSHLYKLRESRLKDLYQNEAMSDNANTVTGYGKDPLTTSHGDALMDQSFQSLKSKEVRDSMSPTHDIKFHSLSLNQPNTTGWDVQTSSEVSPDGRAYRTETVAKTDGVEKLNGGGIAEFKGRNEQRSSASHQGDDKNFVKKASESSDTHLQEKVVFGDENSGRTEMKMSSTTSSSTSQVVSSSSHVEYDDGAEPQRYLLDSQTSQQQRLEQQRQERRLHEERDRIQEQQRRVKQQQLIEERERVQEQHQRQQQQRYSEERHESREQSNTTKNVQTQQHYEENKRYVDMDKASPEYQRHVQHLMAQPGEIISNTVEYPKPNVKMITTVKKLPDGTIVKNKRYETEELRPGNESVRQTNTNTNYSQHRAHDERDQREDRYVKQSPTPRGSEPRDVVDNVETVRRQSAADELTTQSQSYSSVKKSSRRFSTETTSETIEEYDDHPNGSHKSPSPGRDFSTHGFPSVKPHKPTQEYPTDRPSTPQTPRQPTSDFSTQGFPSVKPHKPTQEYPTQRAGTPSSPRQPPTQDFSTHGFPSVRPNKLTQEYPTDRPSSVNEVRYGPNGEEIIVVKSEQSRQVKQQTSSQRTIETEYVSDDYPALQDSAPQKKIAAPQQATPSWEQPTTPRRGHVEDDYSTHGFPSARSPRKEHSEPDGEVITSKTTVSRNHSATHKTNTERIIETEVEQPNRRPEQLSSHGYPAARSPTRSPTRTDYIPISPRRTPSREDYTTQGFPSARSPTKTTPDYATKRAPLYKSPPRKPSGQSTPVSTTTKRTTNEATTTTRRQLQKEREVDATHRAFAASLRSSSPAESNHSGSSSHRRDSHTHPHGNQQRHTPRSSISSTKTYRRDTREGSHDSHAPSETSRISSTTVTRHVGPPTTKSVGKTVVTKQTVVKTRNVQGSNETIDLMPQRSPKSPPASGAKSPISKSAPISTTKTTNTTTIITKPAGQPTAPANISSPSTPAAPSNIAPATIAPVPASSPASPPSSASGPGPAPASVSSELPQVPDQTKTPSSVGKPPIHTSVGRTRVAADTVASRRNLFEKQSPTSTPTKSEETGRRPSYMDHTKSSLEHIRRDSLEINKTNYSRKSSVEDETTYEPRNPNTAVKFDVPKRTTRKEPSCSINDDTNIEEIFDLQVLEELLETVSSYELRRRIRAQIRLIKKNMINSGSTIVTSTTTKTTTVSSKNETEPPKATTANVSRSPQSSRRVPDQTQPRTPRDRSHSPDAKTISSSMKEVRTSSSRRQTTRTEQVDNASLQGKPPVKPRDRSASPAQDPRTGHRSPTGKRGSTSSSPSTQSPERRRDSAAKTPDRNRSPQTKRVESTTTTTTTTKTSGNRNKPVKGAEKTSAPIWADRSKVLRGHTPVSTPPPKKSSTASSNTKITRTTTSSTGSTSSSQKIKRREEDSITSSYGVGPTDENGLPLFGIRALKKKAHPAHEPCATSEEVTGYVIEEQFYSDNKSAPRRERKELIYSTNADELASLQQQVERKSSQDVDDGSVVVREFKKLDKQATQALGYDADDLNIDRKYVRRGSVKEMSEKFIRKESSQSVTESKTSSSTSTSSSASAYPKAGLILRTNSRLSSQEPDAADETEDSESNEVCSVIESAAYTSQQQLQHSQLDDSSADESLQLRQHSSSTRSKQSTRSFLNTTGEDRVVTGVDDVLQRMRNADNVVEPGDSAEDQEARALLNKFLGASVIMQGVESMLPQGGRTTTTSTRTYTQRGGNNNNNANQGDQAVKTTRVTKTYSKTGNSSNNNNSNSSSSLVTRTTCDIEEIWDEDILKQLLEKASTYEERRKIRARLRELMAEREEQKKAVEQTNAEEEESSASEYEEIIEEVTDYSDEEEEEEKEKPTKAAEKSDQKATSIATAEKVEQAVKAEKREEVESASSKVTATTASAKKSTTKTSSASTSSSISVKETSQTDGGVKATQAQQQQQSSTTSERTETKSKDGGAVVTTTTTKVTTRTVGGSAASKNISPLAKFKQLDKEAAQQQAQKSSPTTSTPTTPGGSVQPLFKFTDPALNARAATVKDQLLQWCQQKTQEYENVQITNFSSSWSDGLAFCALIHHFLPKAFDYSTLTKQNRRHNFELAFGVADEKAGIAPLLDVEDMVEMSRPDWKCVFVYVQSIWRRFRNCQ
ncbi:mucin-19 isoform X8 [Scaptodrosophila lebanonensis]|uniref:Mucin-19 isoform X8 n=1 Tax=Drosophila lebanonensis TaxID=7225 RepID=A0A6J2TY58_DROLE|nr:mucin-19 isoform X8 [Scaptodrosophila lebanonensis]